MYRSVSPYVTKLDTVQFSHLQTYFQNNEPLHCSKEPLTISLHFTIFFTYPINASLHFTLLFMLIIPTSHFASLHFTSLHFLSPSLPLTGFHFSIPRFENRRFNVGSTYRPFRELVPVSIGPIHKGVFPYICSLFSDSAFPIMIDPT